MATLLPIVISGLVTGSVYAVFALGLSLVYGVSRTLNFAFGSLYMLAAYMVYFLTERFSIGLAAAALLVLPAMFVIGVVLEIVIVRPLRRHSNWKMSAMMVTLGLALVLDNLTLVLFGPDQKQLPLLLDGTLEFGDVQIGYQDIAVIVIAVLTVAALELFLKYAAVGRAMRAVAQDSQGARMIGIRVERVFTYTFGLSMILAGIAAPLLAPVTLVSPQGGWPLFLKAFVIVVFGGLGSTRGTLAAALILGVVESAVLYQFDATWILPVWLLVLFVVLMVRPRGLFGVWAT